MNKKMSIETIENGIIHVLNQYPTIELVEAAGKYLGKGLMLEKKEEIVAVTVIVYGGAVSRKLIQYAEPLYEVKEGYRIDKVMFDGDECVCFYYKSDEEYKNSTQYSMGTEYYITAEGKIVKVKCCKSLLEKECKEYRYIIEDDDMVTEDIYVDRILYEFREELNEAKKYEEDELPYDNDYTLGLVVCHNGSIFMYAASEAINSDYYNLVVADYIKDGYNDYETQIKAINELQKNFDIIFKEVVAL